MASFDQLVSDMPGVVPKDKDGSGGESNISIWKLCQGAFRTYELSPEEAYPLVGCLVSPQFLSGCF
jgi:hypothetical protein